MGAVEDEPYRRGASSHVTAHGVPKTSYMTRAIAEREAEHFTIARRRPFHVYRCEQGPEHYHLTGAIPDLVPSDGRRSTPERWLAPGELRGWECLACRAWGLGRPRHDHCPTCKSREVARRGFSPCPTGSRRCSSPQHRHPTAAAPGERLEPMHAGST